MIHGIKNEIPPLNTFGAFLYTLRFLRFSYVMFIVDAFPDKFAKDYSELHIYRPITTPRMMYLMTVEAYADINGREMPKALREEYDQMLNVFRRFSFKKYFDEHEKK
jgi:phage tail sheath gpL-like